MSELPYLHKWALAFTWTLLLESVVVWVALLHMPTAKRVSAFLAANCTSHPLLWFVFPVFGPYGLWLVSAETAVIAYEALIYWAILRPHASFLKTACVSIAANVTSCLVGLLLQGRLDAAIQLL